MSTSLIPVLPELGPQYTFSPSWHCWHLTCRNLEEVSKCSRSLVSHFTTAVIYLSSMNFLHTFLFTVLTKSYRKYVVQRCTVIIVFLLLYSYSSSCRVLRLFWYHEITYVLLFLQNEAKPGPRKPRNVMDVYNPIYFFSLHQICKIILLKQIVKSSDFLFGLSWNIQLNLLLFASCRNGRRLCVHAVEFTPGANETNWSRKVRLKIDRTWKQNARTGSIHPL